MPPLSGRRVHLFFQPWQLNEFTGKSGCFFFFVWLEKMTVLSSVFAPCDEKRLAGEGEAGLQRPEPSQ